jgi:hypothetical protein
LNINVRVVDIGAISTPPFGSDSIKIIIILVARDIRGLILMRTGVVLLESEP